jgi:transposase InsO family protein
MSHPIPRLEDVVDTLGKSGAQIHTTLDLASGFWQIPLDSDSRQKTGFITREGVFEFRKLPFGLKNAPKTFQLVMSDVLRGIQWKYALCYIDDILVFSKTFDQHLSHLSSVFARLREANLKLNPSKCNFAAEKVHYLGHILSKDGIEIDMAKTEAVRSFPQPKDSTEVRQFLGLCQYYRRYIQGHSHIAAPLNKLLRKDEPFNWTTECADSFQELKTALTTAPVLAYPDFSKDFILYTDASGHAIVYILGQRDSEGRERVISYAGRGLKDCETRYPITELECLALVEGVKYFHVYLANRHFEAVTDHKALKNIQSLKNPSGRLARWAICLQGYDFTTVFKAGVSHKNADAVSRRPYEDTECPVPTDSSVNTEPVIPDPKLMAYHLTYAGDCDPDGTSQAEHQNNQQWEAVPVMQLETALAEEIVDIPTLQKEDSVCGVVYKYLADDEIPDDPKLCRLLNNDKQDYIIEAGVLYHLYSPRGKGTQSERLVKQLVVPQALKNDILLSYHDSLLGGHQGIERTYHTIRLKYYWRRMYTEIEEYVKSCLDCQRSKSDKHHHKAPLHPLPAAEVFSRIHMDILCSLPECQGYKYILLIVDAGSKWCEAFPLKTMEATEIALILYNEIICRYGAPEVILTDRGQNFMSKLIQEICKLFQITKLQTSSYHPATNASCERFNSVILQTLRTYGSRSQEDWPKLLPSIMFAYRTSVCTSSTQYTPYFLLFGRRCRTPLDAALKPSGNLSTSAQVTLDAIIDNLMKSREIARENQRQAQQKNRTQYDKNVVKPSHKVGDRVWISREHAKPNLSPKLQDKWLGPYSIRKVLTNDTYYVSRDSDGHPVPQPIHANRLKVYHDPQNRESQTAEEQPTVGTRATETVPEQTNTVEPIQVEYIKRCTVDSGRRWYLIKHADRKGRGSTSWVLADMVPQALRDRYHDKRTLKGRVKRNWKK